MGRVNVCVIDPTGLQIIDGYDKRTLNVRMVMKGVEHEWTGEESGGHQPLDVI